MLTANEIIPLLGAVFTVATFVFGALSRDRALQRQYTDDKERLKAEISTIRENFVQKSELRDHINKIENSLERLHTRFDELLKMKA